MNQKDLLSSSKALLDLDADGVLVPHGLGGHGRTCLLWCVDEIERLRGVEQDAAEWVEERTKRLRAEVELLRAALKPFAIASGSYDDDPPARVIASKRGAILSVYDLRAAKAALE